MRGHNICFCLEIRNNPQYPLLSGALTQYAGSSYKQGNVLCSELQISDYMDGWMTCDFTSFSIQFQTYQDNGRVIMKGCVQWNPIYDFMIPTSSRSQNQDG